MKTKVRCVKCNLPENYPGLVLDENGICNYCKDTSNSAEQRHYLGADKLKEDIEKILKENPNRNPDFDCVLAFSGGMDSTFLLYTLSVELKLKVLAVSLRHKYMPAETINNITKITKELGVKHEFVENDFLNDCARYFITKWACVPTYQSLITFCTGCRYGLYKLLPMYAAYKQIPVYCTGETPYEHTDFKVNVTMINPNKPNSLGLILGYGRELIKNPRYLANIKQVMFQLNEFSCKKQFKTFLEENKMTCIRPFFDYINWDEEKLKTVLKRLDWKTAIAGADGWRSDCVINIIRQYYYKKLLGFDESDVRRAQLIRANQAEKDDNNKLFDYAPDVVKKILQEYFDLNFDDIEKRIKKTSL